MSQGFGTPTPFIPPRAEPKPGTVLKVKLYDAVRGGKGTTVRELGEHVDHRNRHRTQSALDSLVKDGLLACTKGTYRLPDLPTVTPPAPPPPPPVVDSPETKNPASRVSPQLDEPASERGPSRTDYTKVARLAEHARNLSTSIDSSTTKYNDALRTAAALEQSIQSDELSLRQVRVELEAELR